MSFSERVEELNQEIGATVERAISELRSQLTERLRASSEQILRQVEDLAPALPPRFLDHEHVAPFAAEASASARQGALSQLRDGLVAMDTARSQAEVLHALLDATSPYASRTAVVLLRGGEIRGWGARGFSGDADVRGLSFTPPDHGGWVQLSLGQGAARLSADECADLCGQLQSPPPHDGVLVPIVLRDQLAAALYADRPDDAGELALEALQTLTYVAAQAIELLPLRERAQTATLQVAKGASPAETPAAAEPAAPAHPAPVEEPSAEEPPPAETHPEALAETHHEDHEAPAPSAQATPPAPAPEPEPPVSATPTSEIRWQTEPEEPAEEELPPLPEMSEMPEVEAAPWTAEPEPEPWTEPEPLAPPQPEETVLLQRPSFEPPPPPEAPEPSYPRPVPVAPPPAPAGFEAAQQAPAEERAASGTPEVRPPSDVDGPGWAFATTRVPVAPDDAEFHESARRLARLLVSEIKLYNEDQVDEGRRNRDLYERLKEDIDRSRQMYEERVEPQVWKSTDYFYQELVRILAAGDSRALGI